MAAWAIGIELGPYELLAPLGAGGMGEVWKARDTRLNRMVAIKRLKVEHTERFQREAHAIAALNHTNICQLYDIGPDYLVMEYVEGAPLKSPLPPEEAIRLAIQIASALEEAHSRGIIHRDLKPANILVNAKGVAKLLDFGLAKLQNPLPSGDSFATLTVGLTEAGAVVGTVAYMSPEQAQGQAVDARSDIFSFGLVLYEMLSGRRAFAGESAFATLSAIVRDEPAPMQTPAALERIVRRCLAKQPAQRFQTMADVTAALAGAGCSEEQPSIAVLPFANMSADKENEYFSDGLAEEIINALAHVPSLTVIARTSAFAFKGKQEDIRAIAQALGVTNVLEGSVRRAGNRVRVTAQLITAANGSHLWSERYDREMADVFAIQDEIAQAIAAALQLKLSPGPRRHTPNLPAYEAYLKALHYAKKLTPEALGSARQCFELAIALDPDFALAHSELAHYFATLANIGLLSAHEAMPSVRSHAQRALEIDASLPEAHAMLGVVAAVYDYDRQEAGRQFRLAMACEPVPVHVRYYHGLFYLLPIGRVEEAAAELERALTEDPLNLRCRVHRAVCLGAAGRNSDADAELKQALQLDKDFWFAHMILALNNVWEGKLPEALACAQRAHSLAPWSTVATGVFAGVSQIAGDKSLVEPLLAKLLPGTAYGAPLGLAEYYIVCGNLDRAADWVEKAIEQRQPAALFFLRNLPRMLASPRWPALARMLKLDQQAS